MGYDDDTWTEKALIAAAKAGKRRAEYRGRKWEMPTAARKGMTETGLWPQLRDYWLPVAFSEEVGEKPLSVRLLDERLALCRLGGEVAAFYDLCAHRGTPISLGRIEGEEVVCAYHGWSYDARGPVHEDSLGPVRASHPEEGVPYPVQWPRSGTGSSGSAWASPGRRFPNIPP